MPTYEYACRDCGEHLDVVQSFHDDPLTECPNCGGSLRKVFSAAGIIFKGSGWHIKDYAEASSSGGNGNGSSSGKDADGGDASKTDTSASSTTDDKGSSTGNDTTRKSSATPASD